LPGFRHRIFGRVFKASTGLSPHQWQLTARITKAQELLLSDFATLSEIALVTGFAGKAISPECSGTDWLSPAAWRREHRRPDPSKSA